MYPNVNEYFFWFFFSYLLVIIFSEKESMMEYVYQYDNLQKQLQLLQ